VTTQKNQVDLQQVYTDASKVCGQRGVDGEQSEGQMTIGDCGVCSGTGAAHLSAHT
jgi:hypothetical protein